MLLRTPGTFLVSSELRGPAPLNTALDRSTMSRPRASLLAIVFFALSVGALFRAFIAYRNGVGSTLTNLPYLDQLLSAGRLVTLRAQPSGQVAAEHMSAFSLTEGRLAYILCYLAVAFAACCLLLALRARHNREPSYRYAGVALMSFGVVALAVRLMTWLYPWAI